MKNTVSRLALFGVDIFSIFISITLAYMLRSVFQDWIDAPLTMEISFYTGYLLIYAVVIVTFFSEKIYRHRFDFWEETRLVLRGLLIALVLILSIFALTKSVEQYSRFVIVFSFVSIGDYHSCNEKHHQKASFQVGDMEERGGSVWERYLDQRRNLRQPLLGLCPCRSLACTDCLYRHLWHNSGRASVPSREES